MNELTEGIGFVPVMIGVFELPELLTQAGQLGIVRERITLRDSIAQQGRLSKNPGEGNFTFLRDWHIHRILPAEGATIASMIGYNEASAGQKLLRSSGKALSRALLVAKLLTIPRQVVPWCLPWLLEYQEVLLQL